MLGFKVFKEKSLKNQDGFTLIELTLVMLVLCVFISLFFPLLNNFYKEKQKNSKISLNINLNNLHLLEAHTFR
tara:strand:- start:211 stop:429 length:219 start_codon:yes stop_codon:yes gene_type:complete